MLRPEATFMSMWLPLAAVPRPGIEFDDEELKLPDTCVYTLCVYTHTVTCKRG